MDSELALLWHGKHLINEIQAFAPRERENTKVFGDAHALYFFHTHAAVHAICVHIIERARVHMLCSLSKQIKLCFTMVARARNAKRRPRAFMLA